MTNRRPSFAWAEGAPSSSETEMMLLTADVSLNDAGKIHNGFVDNNDIVISKPKQKCAGLCVSLLCHSNAQLNISMYSLFYSSHRQPLANRKGHKIQLALISQTASGHSSESIFFSSLFITNTVAKHLKTTTWRL